MGFVLAAMNSFFATAFTLLYHALFKVVQFILFRASFPNKFNIQVQYNSFKVHPWICSSYIPNWQHKKRTTLSNNVTKKLICYIFTVTHIQQPQYSTLILQNFWQQWGPFNSDTSHGGVNIKRAVKLLILINKYFSWQHTCLKEL